MTSLDLATALQRLASGDQSPPRPWAYLAHVGLTHVGDVAHLQIEGYTDQAGFDVTVNGQVYRVMVQAVSR